MLGLMDTRYHHETAEQAETRAGMPHKTNLGMNVYWPPTTDHRPLNSQKVPNQLLPLSRQHTFRMELHAFDGMHLVAQAHDRL